MGSNRLPSQSWQSSAAAAGVESWRDRLTRRSQGKNRGTTPVLADILDPQRNSFGVLLLILALAVLVSHAVFLATNSTAAEPLVALTRYSLGQYGVQGFFILSGLMVVNSIATRRSLVDYARARALRTPSASISRNFSSPLPNES